VSVSGYKIEHVKIFGLFLQYASAYPCPYTSSGSNGTMYNKPSYPDLHIIRQDLGLKNQLIKYVECFHSFEIVGILQFIVFLCLNVLSKLSFKLKCFFFILDVLFEKFFEKYKTSQMKQLWANFMNYIDKKIRQCRNY